MESSNKTLNALSLLGSSSESLPTLDVLEELELFVVQTHIGDKCPEHINTILEIRWYQFSKFQTETDKLPTTASALKYKIFHSHCLAIMSKRPHLSLQNLPPPEDFGWEKIDGELVPIMTDCLPAPMSLIELSVVCSCKLNCKTNRWKCHKTNLNYTDMCKCTNCDNSGTLENDDSDTEIVDEESD